MRFLYAVLFVVLSMDCNASEAAQDHYDVLGVSQSASTDEIRRAYKTLARKWHPDKCKGDDCKERFIALSAAHEVLSNPTKRQEFNDGGHMESGQDDHAQGYHYQYVYRNGRYFKVRVQPRRYHPNHHQNMHTVNLDGLLGLMFPLAVILIGAIVMFRNVADQDSGSEQQGAPRANTSAASTQPEGACASVVKREKSKILPMTDQVLAATSSRGWHVALMVADSSYTSNLDGMYGTIVAVHRIGFDWVWQEIFGVIFGVPACCVVCRCVHLRRT